MLVVMGAKQSADGWGATRGVCTGGAACRVQRGWEKWGGGRPVEGGGWSAAGRVECGGSGGVRRSVECDGWRATC